MKPALLILCALLVFSCHKKDDTPTLPSIRESIAGRWAFLEDTTRFCDITAAGAVTFPEPIPRPLSGNTEPITIIYTIDQSSPDTLKLINSTYPDFFFVRDSTAIRGFHEDYYNKLSKFGFNEIIKL